MLISNNIVFLQEVDSTHKHAVNVANDSDQQCVFIAEKQNSGIGKHGRIWHSPHGNLYISFIAKVKTENLRHISLTVAVGIAEILGKYSSKIRLHWPNDIYCNYKKICGILLQNIDEERVVVSFGINTFHTPTEVQETSSCLKNENLDYDVDNFLLFQELSNNINKWWHIVKADKFVDVVSYWNLHSINYGKSVNVFQGTNNLSGIFMGIDCIGRAVLKSDSNKIVYISSGDMF